MAIRPRPYRSFPLPFLAKPLSFSTLSPPPPPSSDEESLISTAVSILRHHRSQSRFNLLRASLPDPTALTPSLSFHVILRLRSNPRLALRFFLWSRHRDLLPYSATIHVLARARLRPECLSLIRSALRNSAPDSEPDNVNRRPPPPLFEALVKTYRACDSAPFVFDLLIKAYLHSRNLDRAVQIVRLLRSRQIQPLVSTSNSLIRLTSLVKGSAAGLEIYKEIFSPETRVRVSPNVQTFNTLLLSFYRDGNNLEMAEKIRREMDDFGILPNAFTYSILMAGFCDEGMIGKARRIWDEMAGKGMKPDIMAYNTMINGHCLAGEMEKAEELYRELGLRGIEPTGITFEHLIKGYSRGRDVEAALLVYGDMKRRGHRPEAETVDEVVEGMCERRRAAEAAELVRDEIGRGGFGASRRCYEMLVRGFCEEGEMEAAVRVQAEMAGRGFEAGEEVYGAFVEGYRRVGDEEKAGRLEDEMVQMVGEREGD